MPLYFWMDSGKLRKASGYSDSRTRYEPKTSTATVTRLVTWRSSKCHFPRGSPSQLLFNDGRCRNEEQTTLLFPFQINPQTQVQTLGVSPLFSLCCHQLGWLSYCLLFFLMCVTLPLPLPCICTRVFRNWISSAASRLRYVACKWITWSDYRALGCDIVQPGTPLQTFRKNLLPTSSG
jgi:hypothetical protein